MKTPDRCRIGSPPGTENGPTGLYFGISCYRRPTIRASPTTFHTVSLRGSVNKGLSANGMHTSTALPLPGSEQTSNSPPSERFRPLPHRPEDHLRCRFAIPAVSSCHTPSPPCGSKPFPSSSTRPLSSASSTSTLTSMRPHPQCATALRTASPHQQGRLL